MNFQTRFVEHFFHRANLWLITLLVWFAIHWRFDFAFEMGEARDALPPIILLLSYFTLSPAFFFALVGVDPYTPSRSWGYLVEARWPVYVLDHFVNLITLTWLYWLLGAPLGWGLFLPLTQTVYLVFYAARGYLRRIAYYKFEDE